MYAFIVPSTVAARVASLLPDVKMAEIWEESEEEVGDWHENGSNEKGSKCNYHPVKSGLMSARDSLAKPDLRERSCD